MSQVRILHCIRQGKIGGGESHLLDLVQNLNQQQFTSLVLSFTDGPMVTQLKQSGVLCFVIPTLFPFDFRIWQKVSRLVKEHDINLIHVHGTRAFSNVFFAARKNQIPIVYTVHGWSFNTYQGFIRNKVAILAETFFTRIARAVINVSESNQHIGLNHIPGLKSIVIQNGINTSKFDATADLKNLREELNIDADKIVIGFIARMTYQKDPLTLIKAFHILIHKQSTPSKFTLLLVGEGDQKEPAIKLVEELGLTQYVRFEKFRNDVPSLLHSINIYCLPSLWEGLPLGVLEAMAMKKIVIASQVDGTREVIEHNHNGYIFTPGNHEQLSQLLEESIIPNQHNQQISQNACQTILDKFTLAGMVKKTEQVYLKTVQS